MIRKIISGGQTGVDRSALDFCLQNDIDCGGWCQKNRMAEDGIIPMRYPLIETEESDSIFRTRKNIEDADGTLIIFSEKMDEGTSQTKFYAEEINSPLYLIDLSFDFSLTQFSKWVSRNNIKTLNVAGPRESSSPGIYNQAKLFLQSITNLF